MKQARKQPTAWPASKVAHIAYHLARGRSSQEIAAFLNDGTSAGAIRGISHRWKLPRETQLRVMPVVIPMTSGVRRTITLEAARLGLSLEEYTRRVSYCCARGDLYTAVTDGEYD